MTSFRRILAASLLLAGSVVTSLPSIAQAAVPSDASRFVPIDPFRLADTRAYYGAYGFSSPSAKTIRVGITNRSGLPSDATAAVVNITMIRPSGAGFLTAYPSGTPLPLASNVNGAAGNVVANLAHVKIGIDGSIDIYASVATGIAVDLVGVYVPVFGAVSAGRLVAFSTGATRVLDTRDEVPVLAGSVTEVSVAASGVPVSASAVVVNVTAVRAPVGFWTVYPFGIELPNTSSLNIDLAGQTRASQSIVPFVTNDLKINVASLNGGHFLVDVVGYFTGSSDPSSTVGLFVPRSPLRVFDTRTNQSLAPWGGSTFEFLPDLSVATISAVAMNVTATRPWDNGYVTAFPAGVERPLSSTLNLSAWRQTIANHAIVRVSTRGVSLYTNAGTHLIADVAGWYTGAPIMATKPVPAIPTFARSRVIVAVAPKFGLSSWVQSGKTLSQVTSIVNLGQLAVNTGLDQVPVAGNVMLFGHRTSYGGVLKRVNELVIGDSFSLISADLHTYTYRVVSRRIVLPSYKTINAVSSEFGPITAQLVACSKLDFTPTSLSYRIVVTGRLVSVV